MEKSRSKGESVQVSAAFVADIMSSLVMYIGKGGLSGQTLDDSGILNAMAPANPLNNEVTSESPLGGDGFCEALDNLRRWRG